MNATTMQPTSLKALAARVRLCNSLCNTNATQQLTMQTGTQLSMQLSPGNDPKVALKVALVHGAEIQKMSLSDFEKAGLILKVWSDILNDHIYFIPSNEHLKNCDPSIVTYTARELRNIVHMQPEEVISAHQVKTIFQRARVITHRKGGLTAS